MDLPEAFDTFHDKISLGIKATQKIEVATGGLTKYLSDQYGLGPGGVFLQGSCANDTAVEPEDRHEGEYDADLISLSATPGMSSDEALDDLVAVLCQNGTYEKLIRLEGSKKKPCVRLRYADDEVGGFHVDVVPARASASADPQAPLEVPRRGAGWHDTAPAEYTDWCRSNGPRFARTVKMLKRWREHHQPARQSIKSIVLQVLASNSLGSQNSDAQALVSTLRGVKVVLDESGAGAPTVLNPVLLSEDLAARWDATAYQNFRKELDEAVSLAERALASTNVEESHRLWRELLGDDFPSAPARPAVPPTVTPSTPAPGFQDSQAPPRRERYG